MGGYPDFSLTGRTALVTGSVRGLGLEMARGLAGAGARVVLNGRDAGTLDTAAARLRDEGLNVTAAAFDVTDQDTAGESVTALGPVDVLVNNVGHRDRRGVDALAPGDLARRGGPGARLAHLDRPGRQRPDGLDRPPRRGRG